MWNKFNDAFLTYISIPVNITTCSNNHAKQKEDKQRYLIISHRISFYTKHYLYNYRQHLHIYRERMVLCQDSDKKMLRTFLAAEGTGFFVDRDFGGTDDGRNAPCGLRECFGAVLFRQKAQYARLSALSRYRSIRASNICAVEMMQIPGSKAKLDRCAVCAHTPGE